MNTAKIMPTMKVEIRPNKRMVWNGIGGYWDGLTDALDRMLAMRWDEAYPNRGGCGCGVE